MKKSRSVAIKVWGDAGLFTRPESAAERVSYPCITPSAAQGLLSSIYWHPKTSWRITSIELLKPPTYSSITRNEVSSRATTRNSGIDVMDDRVQRHSRILRDLSYVIRAYCEIDDSLEDDPAKFTAQFSRRVERGAFFTPPYLGLREFAADFGPPTEDDRPCQFSLDVGPMLLDLGYDQGGHVHPIFFDAVITDGVMKVPHPSEVAR